MGLDRCAAPAPFGDGLSRAARIHRHQSDRSRCGAQSARHRQHDQAAQGQPRELGKLLGADALVYGQVDKYQGYYYGLVSAYVVGVDTWMLSTHDGETLIRENGSRYSVDINPAFSPQDIIINSAMTLLDFRNVTLARAEDEVSRELVLRIPVSEKLKQQMADAAVAHANEVEAAQLEATATPPHPAQADGLVVKTAKHLALWKGELLTVNAIAR